MLSEFISNNIETVVIGLSLIIVLLIVVMILLIKNNKNLGRRITVLENFDRVINLLNNKNVKQNNQIEVETETTDEVDTTNLKDLLEMYKKVNRGEKLTKEEEERLND